MKQISKILILGAKGMLGQELAHVFADLKPTLWDKKDIDITKKDVVARKIKSLKPNIIINAAAYTAVDDCEKNQKLAYQVNGKAVGYMAQSVRELGATVVHFSTDYVFEGKKKSGYRENDKTHPLSIYGKSKGLGEKELVKNTDRYYLIRTSWLYGKGGKNFVETMLKLAKVQKELKVVNDQVGKPTLALDLALRTKEILKKKPPFGIYHLTNEGFCSWYQFAKEIFKIKKIKVKLKPSTTKEFPRPASRPAYSILINTKLKKSRHWQKALRDYLLLD